MKKTLTLLTALFAMMAMSAQTDLIISEYIEAWGNNKVLEIFNPTSKAINLSDYVVKRYSNGSSSASGEYTVELPDVSLEPYKTFVIAQDKRESAGTVPADDSPIWAQVEARTDYFVPSDYGSGPGTKCIHWNGNDAVTLEKTDGTKVDIFGKIGESPAAAYIPGSTDKIESWTDTPPYFTGSGIGLSADHTLVRKSSVTTGVSSNPSLFNTLGEYDSLSVSTFHKLGWHEYDGAPANTAPVVIVDELYYVSPSAVDGSDVMTVGYTDGDRDQTMKFFLGEGNYIYIDEGADTLRHTPFALDRATGKLTVSDADAISKRAGDTIYCEVYVCDEYAQSEGVFFDVVIAEEPASIKEQSAIETSLSPNPAQNQFIVKADQIITAVSIYNLTGRELYRQVANAKRVSVDFDLPSGGYVVKTMFADNNVGVDKLIVE